MNLLSTSPVTQDRAQIKRQETPIKMIYQFVFLRRMPPINNQLKQLNEASSRSLDKICERFEYNKLKLGEELEEAAEALGLSAAARVNIENEIREDLSGLQRKLRRKHSSQVQHVQDLEGSPFILSRGSRKVSGLKYVPPVHCNCNKQRIRPHRLRKRVWGRRKLAVKSGQDKKLSGSEMSLSKSRRSKIPLI